MLFNSDMLTIPEGWDPEELKWVEYNNPTPSIQQPTTEFLSQNNTVLPYPLIGDPKPLETENTTTTVSETTTSDTGPSIKFTGSQKEFLNTMKSVYKKVLTDYNNTHDKKIDLKYIDDLVAHDAIESGYGKHTSGDNNYGGIKVTDKQAAQGIPYKLRKTFEYINGKKVTMYSKFRSFSSIDDYVRFKINFLTSGRYSKAGVFFSPDSFASQLKRAGYYTCPISKYEASLNRVKKSMP